MYTHLLRVLFPGIDRRYAEFAVLGHSGVLHVIQQRRKFGD
jgi:hypothetical protein